MRPTRLIAVLLAVLVAVPLLTGAAAGSARGWKVKPGELAVAGDGLMTLELRLTNQKKKADYFNPASVAILSTPDGAEVQGWAKGTPEDASGARVAPGKTVTRLRYFTDDGVTRRYTLTVGKKEWKLTLSRVDD